MDTVLLCMAINALRDIISNRGKPDWAADTNGPTMFVEEGGRPKNALEHTEGGADGVSLIFCGWHSCLLISSAELNQ